MGAKNLLETHGDPRCIWILRSQLFYPTNILGLNLWVNERHLCQVRTVILGWVYMRLPCVLLVVGVSHTALSEPHGAYVLLFYRPPLPRAPVKPAPALCR